MRLRRGRGLVTAGVVGLMALGATACGSSNSGSSGGAASGSSGGGKTYKIVMSNGFVSVWRTEMQELAKAMAAGNAPYKGHVDMKVVVSDTSPTAQIQSINNIIATKPDAILIDALSPTALNPVVKRACAQGILVVYFDQVGTQMDKCAYRVHNNEYALFQNNAEWLAKTLKGKGRVLQDLGLPGSPISQIGTKAAADVFKKYPGIKIAAKYEGNYTPGPTKQAVTRILTSTKNIDGVYGIAGVDGAVQAFQETNTKMIPMTNFGDMSVRLTNLIEANKSNGLQFNMAENAPTLAGQALQVAWAALNKQPIFGDKFGFTQGGDPKEVFIPKVAYNTNGLPPIAGFQKTTYQQLLDMSKGLPEQTLIPYALPQSPVPSNKVVGSS
ncbi:MAG: ribose transport system substrate-binding protein [Baekduia sp.]|nr:sugar transporter substrate-binding protein [Conexibacter sp.]MDX6716175.1 ribose transport system substrate-binding protein [Baekduia sp.]MDX6732428.1 ribose transport system substrate-binding protein [Baekduia sp.]